MKRNILIALLLLTTIAGVFCGIYLKDEQVNDVINNIQDKLIEEIQKEIIVSKETQKIVNETKEATENKENISTVELIESSEQEEQSITDEGAIETDAVVEQENISYNGDFTGNGVSLLGEYQGLTYYSQADSRWADIMYSSTNNASQTMKSSACRTNFNGNGSIKLKRCNIANYTCKHCSRQWIQNSFKWYGLGILSVHSGLF